MPEPGDPGKPEYQPVTMDLSSVLFAIIAELAKLHPAIAFPVIWGVMQRFGEDVWVAVRDAWEKSMKEPLPGYPPGWVWGDPLPPVFPPGTEAGPDHGPYSPKEP